MGHVTVITGGSSGIGKATAAFFVQKGHRVYELSRTGKNENGVSHITADITKPEELKAAFAEIFVREGRLDILINNAGMGISGAVEFTDLAQARKIVDVNFFGTFLSCREALPYLRQTKGARIINVSSVAAPVAIPFQAFYSATKAAVNSLSLAMANELRPFGVFVSALMPGDVHTGFTEAREKSEAGAELYGAAISRAVSAMEKDERTGMSPAYIASLIYKISQKKRPKPLYTAGWKYRLIVFLIKLLPASLVNRLVGKLYG